MRVLVAAASRHESTLEVAAQIARVLRAAGHEVVALRVDDVADVSSYDAVVVGSAVYFGRWMRSAFSFVDGNRGALARVPLWLFSVGVLVDDAADAPPPPVVAELARRAGARDHHWFRGALAAERLGWSERLAVSLVRAPYGDFRDWTAVRSWAETIAHALDGDRPVPGRLAAGATA